MGLSAIVPSRRAPSPPSGLGAATRRAAASGLLGLALGLSPVLHGGYASTTWIPAGLVVIAAVVVLAIAAPLRLTRPGALAVGGVAGLGLWSLASARWAPSASIAALDGQRLLALAGLLLLLLLLVRERRSALSALVGALAGVGGVAAWTVGRLLAEDGGAVLLAGRLNEPLGYVNGQGSIYVLGALAALGIGGAVRSAAAAGAAAAAATLLAGLALLCQSRGVLAALVVGALVVVLAVDGRVRRAWAALLVAAALVAIAGTLGDVLGSTTYRGTPPSAVHHAGRAVLLAAGTVGVAWAACVALASRLRGTVAVRGRTAARVALAAVVGAALLVGVVRSPVIADRVAEQYRAFVGVEAQADGAGSRLFSGAGTRYDYWRIAWGSFRAHPLAGEGAGGFVVPYFRQRRTTEAVQQAHSVLFGTLGELGLVGAAFLLVLVAGLALAVGGAARRTGRDPVDRALAAAGAGMAAAWLLHSCVDWIVLLPGVTGVGFVGVALVVRAAAPPPPAAAPAGGAARGRGAWVQQGGRLAAAAVVAVALVAAVGMGRRLVADRATTAARAAVATDPARAVRLADRAIRLDRDRMDAYYARAAALARFGDARPAIATLRAALARQPDSFVTWALLGDLQVRSGDRPAARRAYRRALALNPRDAGLRAALRQAR
ncbi:O-antigen ligase family protein [Patulibacter sp. SYSU D01012]|uniref:O-antigen ligase family protein n=1 Tax=Patulibacter sp. SYSU D01012 TaxID=2817381 RepID=UPI001B3165BB